MQRKILVLALTVLLLNAVSFAYAMPSLKYTFLSGKFNSTSVTAKALNETYASGFKTLIDNNLVYNASEATNDPLSACVILADTATGSTNSVTLDMNNATALNVTVVIDGTSEKIFSDNETASTIHVSLSKSGSLNIGSTTDIDAYVDSFAFGSCFNFTHILTNGTSTYTADSGYVSVTTLTLGESAIDIESWIPALISIAMLGMVIGMMKKMM